MLEKTSHNFGINTWAFRQSASSWKHEKLMGTIIKRSRTNCPWAKIQEPCKNPMQSCNRRLQYAKNLGGAFGTVLWSRSTFVPWRNGVEGMLGVDGITSCVCEVSWTRHRSDISVTFWVFISQSFLSPFRYLFRWMLNEIMLSRSDRGDLPVISLLGVLNLQLRGIEGGDYYSS